MIRRITPFKIPLLFCLVLFGFHFLNKDFDNAYSRPIAGDAQAYYAYLPAIFIYHDLSYGFVDDINQQYYPPEHQKSFLKPAGNGKVNKTFPGIALLYLPFFLLAHALALLFGLEADGYSTVYQVCFDLGLWFYLLLGLVCFAKILTKAGFALRTANISATLILLGTNIVFYSVYDQSVTHIYNFFLINALLLCLLRYKENPQFWLLGAASFLIALIGIIRPTNILVVFLILFFIPDLAFYKRLFSDLLKPKNGLRVLLISASVLSIPFILWKIQTGHWIVYSYGEEGFDFAHPHFVDFIFSYLKGWLVYTPLALMGLLIGFFFLFKLDKRQFFIGLVFYFVSIYVFSSWWCWYYGAGMGQRVMIDHYILLGFLLALILERLAEKRVWKITFLTFVALCIGLNLAQAYQIGNGILTGGSATKQQYWDNFLVFEKRARVYPHDHWQLEAEQFFTLDENDPGLVKGESYGLDNERMLEVTEQNPFSASLKLNAETLRKGSKLIIGFEARAAQNVALTRAVLDLGGTSHVFGLDTYLKKDQWVKIEFMVEPQQPVDKEVILYFWNGESTEKVQFRRIQTATYFSEAYL